MTRRGGASAGGARVGKQLVEATFVGQEGINLIERRVLAMRCGWTPTPGGMDAGIDGHVEMRNPDTGEMLNAVVRVQSKATARPFDNETADRFTYTCTERDLDYWMRGNAPVVLVVSRPSTDEAYWVPIKEYFREPSVRKSRVITFDKRAHRFDAGARDALLRLAVPRDAGFYFAPPPRIERLYSNLLAVARLPQRLYLGETSYGRWTDANRRLREAGSTAFEWTVKGKRVLSVYDLDEHPWTSIVDRGSVEDFDGTEWAETDDPDRLRDFVELLNRCLSARVRPLGLRYDAGGEYYYFEATPDLSPRKVRYQSLRKGSTRTVFERYATKKSGEAVREFCRHVAFKPQFRRYDGEWFLEITPHYHFTADGRQPLRFARSKLSGIKALEKNGAVLGQVVMWADLLRGRTDDLFAPPPYPFLAFDELRSLEVGVGVNDTAWLPDEAEDDRPAGTADDLPLFSEPSPYAE